MKYVLPNKLLWYIAVANVFVYLLRYGILDWPTYLKEVKHFALDKSSWAYFLYEYAGIPGTAVWLDVGQSVPWQPWCDGRVLYDPGDHRHRVYWLNPPGVDMACIVIGFLIYGPVMLIGLHAGAGTEKSGTAAGFTGLFGYLGGSVAASHRGLYR
jgi:OPA family glycerol-3-phosphate transporter-like MFS transporter